MKTFLNYNTMTYFKPFLAVLLMTVTALGAVSCSGSDDGSDNPVDIALTLTPSATVISQGGQVTFTLLNGTENVTAEARFFNADTDETIEIPFAPAKAEVYRIAAEYDNHTSDPVAITVVGSYEGASNFYRSTLMLQFTATWCKYCPAMTAIMQQYEELMPGRMCRVAVHSSDDFKINESGWFFSMFDIPGLPQAVLDYQEKGLGTSTTLSWVRNTIQKRLEEDPAVCGIMLSTSQKESSEDGDQKVGPVEVRSRVRFAQDGTYLVGCFVIEDGLYKADGYEPKGRYDDVLRAMATPAKGLELGERKAGEEYPLAFTFTPEGWNLDNCSVVVYILRMSDKGLAVNNVAHCKVGASCDFAYEE